MKLHASDDAARPKLGRPLSFDRDAALEQAMLTFWRHGYETTSIVDLTTAMRITAPSLYGTFGDKRRLFLEAVRFYIGDLYAITQAIDAAPTALDAARDMLRNAATAYTGDTTPAGCLLASATASGSSASEGVQREIAAIRSRIEGRLRARVEHDRQTNRLPRDTDCAALAGMVMAVSQGMSVLARDGADRASLLAITDQALRAWPRPAST